MGVNIWVNRGRVYLDIYTHGKRRREKLEGLIITGNKAVDKETIRLAEIARAKRAQQVFSEEWGIVDPVAGKQTLYEYMKHIAEQPAKKKREAILSTLKHLEKFKCGLLPIKQINEKWIEDFQNYLLNTVSTASAYTYSSMVRSALNRAVKDTIIIANPAKNVKRIKAPESKRVWLTGEELSRLAATPLDGVNGEEIRRAFLFGCYTGLRISDMKTLVWGEIAYSPMRIAKKQKKTEENVYIPVNKTAWGIINDKRIHDYREAVFPALFAARQGYHPRLVKWAKSSGAAKADRVAYGAAYVRDYAA